MTNNPIQIIAEGSTRWQRFIKHWGLSILIGEEILFDTFGQPNFAISQFKKKKIDINKIKHIILSHEHWDHINGLSPILAINPNVTVYLGRHFSEGFKERVKSVCKCLVEIDKPVQITDSIFTTAELFGLYDGQPLYESGLVIKDEKGLSLIVGCAHPGLKTMITSVQKQFNQPIEMIMGGFHLQSSTNSEIDSIIYFLQQQKISKIVPLHCTGQVATHILEQTFKNNVNQN